MLVSHCLILEAKFVDDVLFDRPIAEAYLELYQTPLVEIFAERVIR